MDEALGAVQGGAVVATTGDLTRSRIHDRVLDTLISSSLGRFFLVGAFCYAINQSALAIIYELVLGGPVEVTTFGVWRFDVTLLLASVAALETSIVMRFALNDGWTFRQRRVHSLSRRFYLFHASSLVSPFPSVLALNVLTPQFGVGYLAANSLGIALGVAWNWYCCSQVVWRSPATSLSAGSHS